MSEAQLSILNYALLAVLYVFFGRVLWAVWSEVKGPRPAAAHNTRGLAPGVEPERAGRGQRAYRGTPSWLKVLEPSVRKGAAYAIEGEMIIGRSPDSTIVLPDDTFASSMHARVWAVDGEVWVEDLGSTNGTTLNGSPLRNAARLGKGDRIQIGNTLFEAD